MHFSVKDFSKSKSVCGLKNGFTKPPSTEITVETPYSDRFLIQIKHSSDVLFLLKIRNANAYVSF